MNCELKAKPTIEAKYKKKYRINVVFYLLCLHVEDMWCTILKQMDVFIEMDMNKNGKHDDIND